MCTWSKLILLLDTVSTACFGTTGRLQSSQVNMGHSFKNVGALSSATLNVW